MRFLMHLGHSPVVIRTHRAVIDEQDFGKADSRRAPAFCLSSVDENRPMHVSIAALCKRALAIRPFSTTTTNLESSKGTESADKASPNGGGLVPLKQWGFHGTLSETSLPCVRSSLQRCNFSSSRLSAGLIQERGSRLIQAVPSGMKSLWLQETPQGAP